MSSTLEFLVEWSIRSSVLMLAGALLLWLLRVTNPSVRLAAWTAVLTASLAIPLLTTTLPKLPLNILRASTSPPTISSATVSVEPQISVAPPVIQPTVAPPPATISTPFDWSRFAVILYATATLTLLLRLAVGLFLSRRILRQSSLTGLLVEGAEVRESAQVASPVTIGILRPAMLLPLDWRDWDSEKLNAVLAHEGSHIRRHDPALQLLSSIYRALLWVNPASWLLHNCIVRTAEDISDQDAIAVTYDRVSYAEILLEFVQRGASDAHLAGVPMARYDRPENRIRRILNSPSIASGISRYGIASILSVAAPLTFLTAAANPQSAAPLKPTAIAQAPVQAVVQPASPIPPPTLLAAQRPATTPQQQTVTAQATSVNAVLPQFEVATIKPTVPGGLHRVGLQIYPRARVVIPTASLKSLITTAFGVSYADISGGGDWPESETYDIEAQPSPAMQAVITDLRYTLFTIEDTRLRQMLQALLIDRFQLKFHRETKSSDVYLLKRNGKPFAVSPTESPIGDDPSKQDSGAFGSIGYAGGQWGIFDTTMPQLAKFAADYVLRAPVLDRTELSGRFKYRQQSPDIDPKYSGDQLPSFQSYLDELGLKLERGKGTIETFVIDGAEKPSAN